MAFRIVASLALVSLVSAGLVSVPAPAHQVYHQAAQEYHPAPQVYHQAAQEYHPAPQVYHQAPQATYVSHAPAPVAVYKPAVQHVIAKQDEEFDPHPQYKFGYDVQDTVSGDSKSQVEERDGDVVRGEYSLIDADGFKRTVQYTADDHNGFNAVVNRVPLEHTHTVVKAAPVAYAAAAPHNYHH